MCEGINAGDAVDVMVMDNRRAMRLVKIDACIADIVAALNNGGPYTINSCCGHGRNPGGIVLADGRMLAVFKPGERDTWLEWHGQEPDHA